MRERKRERLSTRPPSLILPSFFLSHSARRWRKGRAQPRLLSLSPIHTPSHEYGPSRRPAPGAAAASLNPGGRRAAACLCLARPDAAPPLLHRTLAAARLGRLPGRRGRAVPGAPLRHPALRRGGRQGEGVGAAEQRGPFCKMRARSKNLVAANAAPACARAWWAGGGVCTPLLCLPGWSQCDGTHPGGSLCVFRACPRRALAKGKGGPSQNAPPRGESGESGGVVFSLASRSLSLSLLLLPTAVHGRASPPIRPYLLHSRLRHHCRRRPARAGKWGEREGEGGTREGPPIRRGAHPAPGSSTAPPSAPLTHATHTPHPRPRSSFPHSPARRPPPG